MRLQNTAGSTYSANSRFLSLFYEIYHIHEVTHREFDRILNRKLLHFYASFYGRFMLTTGLFVAEAA
jgi:hypothetical protein